MKKIILIAILATTSAALANTCPKSSLKAKLEEAKKDGLIVTSDQKLNWDKLGCAITVKIWNNQAADAAAFYCRASHTIVYREGIEKLDLAIYHEMIHSINNPQFEKTGEKHPYSKIEEFHVLLNDGPISSLKVMEYINSALTMVWDEAHAYGVQRLCDKNYKDQPHLRTLRSMYNSARVQFGRLKFSPQLFERAYLLALQNPEFRDFKNSREFISIRFAIHGDNPELIDPYSFF